MLRFINPFFFFISLCVGLFIVYIVTPKPQIVFKFPSPYNAEKVTYRTSDEETGTHTCFKVKADAVSCPKDQSLIKSQPLPF